MDNVYRVTDLIPMEKLLELLKDPAIKQKAIDLGWGVPELDNLVLTPPISKPTDIKEGRSPNYTKPMRDDCAG